MKIKYEINILKICLKFNNYSKQIFVNQDSLTLILQ